MRALRPLCPAVARRHPACRPPLSLAPPRCQRPGLRSNHPKSHLATVLMAGAPGALDTRTLTVSFLRDSGRGIFGSWPTAGKQSWGAVLGADESFEGCTRVVRTGAESKQKSGEAPFLPIVRGRTEAGRRGVTGLGTPAACTLMALPRALFSSLKEAGS